MNGFQVTPGVTRLGSRQVNWHLVEEQGAYTVVDAGFPLHFDQLAQCLEKRGHTISEVAALVLTHGHGDHIGFAERLRDEAGVQVLIHRDDAAMATTGERPPSERPSVNTWVTRPSKSSSKR